MRTFAFFVVFILIATLAVAAPQKMLKVGADPQNPSRTPSAEEVVIVIDKPLCGAFGSGHGVVRGCYPRGTAVVGQFRQEKMFRPDWIAYCGNIVYEQTGKDLSVTGKVIKAASPTPVFAPKPTPKSNAWDRLWKAFGDFPWWILLLLLLLGLAGYGLYRVLRDWGNNPTPTDLNTPPTAPAPVAPAPTPTPAPVVGPRPIIPIDPTPNPAPTPVSPAPTPTPNPAPAPTGESRETEIAVLNGGEVEITVPEGTRIVGQQMSDGRFRFRVSRA